MSKELKFKTRAWIRKFVRARRGAVSVEFALIAGILFPLMLFGSVETVQILRGDTVFEEAVDTLGQIIATQGAVTPVMLKDYCAGVQKMLYPFSTTGFNIAIASVSRPTAGGNPVRDWEVDNACVGTATAIGANQAVTLATPLVTANGDSAIVISGTYPFQTSLHKLFPLPITFSQTILISPRGAATITCSGC